MTTAATMQIARMMPLAHDADSQIFPLLAHLEEVRTGHGFYESMRTVTIGLDTMLLCVANTATRRNEKLIRMISDAGRAWLTALEQSGQSKLPDRVAVHAKEWEKISRAVRIFLHIMPQIKIYIWANALTEATERWDYVQNQQTHAKLQ